MRKDDFFVRHVGSKRMLEMIDKHGGFEMLCRLPNEGGKRYIVGDPGLYLPQHAELDVGLTEVRENMYVALGLTYLWDGMFMDLKRGKQYNCQTGTLAIMDAGLIQNSKVREVPDRRSCIKCTGPLKYLEFKWKDGVFNFNDMIMINTKHMGSMRMHGYGTTHNGFTVNRTSHR